MKPDESPDVRGRVLGRYVLYDEIASGGMGVVHLGRHLGPAGFTRTVAVKRLHPHMATNPEFVAMFLDEARLAARIRHPNVVSTLDVVALSTELFLVMEYIEGESLSHLLRAALARGEPVPLRIAAAIMMGALLGLHAAHEARGDAGAPLGIVHRDVSPQNIFVGADGVSRVLDFGIAKAEGRMQTTRDGQIKGKTSYMAPEQLRGRGVDARTDIYGASVVFWELLTGKRLFLGAAPEETMTQILEREVPPPSTHRPQIPPELDAVILRGLSREPGDRFASAREMVIAIEPLAVPTTARELGEWVVANATDGFQHRRERVAAIERQTYEASARPADESGDGSRTETDDVVTFSGTRIVESVRPLASVGSGPIAEPVKTVKNWSRGALVALVILGVSVVAVLAWARQLRSAEPRASSSASAPNPSDGLGPAPLPSPLAQTTPVSNATPTAAARSSSHPVPAKNSPAHKRCNPPYVIDGDGFRVPKLECF